MKSEYKKYLDEKIKKIKQREEFKNKLWFTFFLNLFFMSLIHSITFCAIFAGEIKIALISLFITNWVIAWMIVEFSEQKVGGKNGN